MATELETFRENFISTALKQIQAVDLTTAADTDLIVTGALMEAVNRAVNCDYLSTTPPTTDLTAFETFRQQFLTKTLERVKATDLANATQTDLIVTGALMEAMRRVVPNQLETVYSFTIDENQSVGDSITVGDGAVGKTREELMEWLGIKPVVLLNGVEVGDVMVGDFTKYANGTTIPTTLGYDIMIKFPRRGIKVTKSGGKNTYTMTTAPNASGFDYSAFNKAGVDKDAFYVGVYHAYASGSKLYSSSGKTATVNTTLTNFRNYAVARGTGYQLWSFDMVEYIQACYCLVFQHRDSQSTVGYGYVASSGQIATGQANLWGMNFGYTTNQTNAVKCLGIENLWGNLWAWVDGLYIDGNLNVTKAVNNTGFSDTGVGYKTIGSHKGWASAWYNMKQVAATNDNKFFPAVTGGSTSYNEYYFDGQYCGVANRCAFFGGHWYYSARAGLWCWDLNCAAGYSSSNIGSRLSFL